MENKIYYDLLMEWNKYIGEQAHLRVLEDMYAEALFWLNIFKDATWWREGLQ